MAVGLESPGTAAAERVPAGNRSGWAPALLAAQWCIVAIGAALRVRQYAFRRSLWTDEAMIALNVTHRGYWALTRPLALLQGAPFGWLWLERACTQILGNGEYQLRLPALVAGLLLLWWALILVRRHLSPLAGAVALLVLAAAPALVYYGSEVKPYGVDAAAAVGLLVVATRQDRTRLRGAGIFALAAVVAVLFSYPAVFVAGAVGLVSALVAIRRRQPVLLGTIAVGGCLWGGTFALQYLRALRPTANNPAMKAFWAAGYAPRPLAPGSTWRWLVHDAGVVARYPFEMSVPVLALILAVGGTATLAVAGRRGRRRMVPAPGADNGTDAIGGLPGGVDAGAEQVSAAQDSGSGAISSVDAAGVARAGGPPGTTGAVLASLVAVTVAAVVAAAIVSAYPLRDRMVLFLLPILAVVAAAAVDVTGHGPFRLVLAAAVVVAWAGTLPHAVDRLSEPYTRTEFREALLYAVHHEKPGDQVWLQDDASALYAYYSPLLHVRVETEFELNPGACGKPAPPLRSLRPGRHLWLVFAIPPGIPIRIAGQLAAFGPLGHLDLWRPTSAGAGVARITVGAKIPAQLHAPSGCLLPVLPARFS